MTFSVTILGSNSALPTTKRYPTAQVLNVSERFFLIDCGEGTQLQMRVNHIKLSKIHHIFISHLHGDHCFGLIGFISTIGLLGRTQDLHIYAHQDLESLLSPQLAYFCADLPFSVKFYHLNTKAFELIHEDRKVEVFSIPLKHRVPTCGFLFREKSGPPNIRKSAISEYNLSIADMALIKRGEDMYLSNGQKVEHCKLVHPARPVRSYAFCSDTAYYPSIIPYIKDVDLLYHEATFTDEHKQLARKTTHSTALQAATIALSANAGKLLLGHFSNRYDDLSQMEQEAKDVFQNVHLVNDGEVHHIEIKNE